MLSWGPGEGVPYDVAFRESAAESVAESAPGEEWAPYALGLLWSLYLCTHAVG
jgi:hypothetical protein